MDRFEHGVVEVCERIHGDATGTGDEMAPERLRALVDWLEWRVGDGWAPSEEPGDPAYDAAVRGLGVAAVALGRRTLGMWAGVAP